LELFHECERLAFIPRADVQDHVAHLEYLASLKGVLWERGWLQWRAHRLREGLLHEEARAEADQEAHVGGEP
jgi:hypothetical protein